MRTPLGSNGFYDLYENPSIEKTNSTYGRWVIKYSEVSFRFFWRKKQAEEWLNQYKNGTAEGVHEVNPSL